MPVTLLPPEPSLLNQIGALLRPLAPSLIAFAGVFLGSHINQGGTLKRERAFKREQAKREAYVGGLDAVRELRAAWQDYYWTLHSHDDLKEPMFRTRIGRITAKDDVTRRHYSDMQAELREERREKSEAESKAGERYFTARDAVDYWESRIEIDGSPAALEAFRDFRNAATDEKGKWEDESVRTRGVFLAAIKADLASLHQ